MAANSMAANYRFYNGEIQMQLTDGWVRSAHDTATREEALEDDYFKIHKPSLRRAFEQKFATDDPNGRR